MSGIGNGQYPEVMTGRLGMARAMHGVLADLYRIAVEVPLESFKLDALRSAKRLMPFDSAVWGSGVLSSNTMLSLAPLDQPSEMLLEYAARWQDSDYCRLAAVEQPGRAFSNSVVQPIELYRKSAIYREFSRTWQIEDALTIVHPDRELDLAEIVCLFRSDRDAMFDEREAGLLEEITPHLANAWRLAQIAHYYRMSPSTGATMAPSAGRYAVATSEGLLRAAGATFMVRLREAAPDWAGPALPAALSPLLTDQSTAITVGGVPFRARQADNAILLTTTDDERAWHLTPAERRAADLYIAGATKKDIAKRLGISPSTVRNQLASVYAKLECRTKIELLKRLVDMPH